MPPKKNMALSFRRFKKDDIVLVSANLGDYEIHKVLGIVKGIFRCNIDTYQYDVKLITNGLIKCYFESEMTLVY